MQIVTMHEAATNLASLLNIVQQGERILIERDGQTVAELAPVATNPLRRRAGIDQNKIQIADDFNAPLPDAVLSEFMQ
jgi:antitoxin (DNA-binding transcriptional repressor) of toxin-antitoxin stability system